MICAYRRGLAVLAECSHTDHNRNRTNKNTPTRLHMHPPYAEDNYPIQRFSCPQASRLALLSKQPPWVLYLSALCYSSLLFGSNGCGKKQYHGWHTSSIV